MKPGQLNLNWFDVVVCGALLVGLIRGRLRGMSAELLPLLQWLLVISVGAHTYVYLGRALDSVSGLGPTFCNITAYLLEALILTWAFTALKHTLGDRILTADAFGKNEYLIGMAGGLLRYAAILVFGLALLNAFYVSDDQKAANIKMQRDNFGKVYFPTLGLLQDQVFHRSLTGPILTRHLSTLLLQPAGAPGPRTWPTLGQRRQQELDQITGK